MSVRTMQLVQIVRDNPGISGSELARMMRVTDRSVRAYIRQANDSLAGFASISSECHRGYSLSVTDEPRFSGWLRKEGEPANRGGITPDERVAFLLNTLLTRTDWVTIDELSELLHVCRMTISADLKHVEERLGRFGLSLERRPRYGMRVTGDEMGRRVCLAAGVVESLVENRPSGSESSDARALATMRLDDIARIVDAALDVTGWVVNSLAYQNLLVHIAITVLRAGEGNFIPMDDATLERIRTSAAFPVAERIASGIEGLHAVTLPQSEVAYIAIHLAGKQSTIPGAPATDADADPLVINDEVWDAVSEMLALVWRVYHFDLRNDLELRMNLARHIVPLAVRLKYGMKIENPVLSDTRKRYPLAYAIAVDSGAVLAKRYGSALSEDETGYIALAFALALERQRTMIAKKSILVVCATGHGSACMLEHRYRQQFGRYLDAIYTCDASHVDRFDVSKVDYVFTTVPLSCSLPVPVREVSFFLDEADTALVTGLLASGEGAFAGEDMFSERMPRELFYGRMAASDRAALLDLMCRRMVERAPVDDTLRELVERRETCVPTTFGNGVAIPHPLEPVCDRTVISVAILDDPVDWMGEPVSVVMLIAISREDGSAMSRLMAAIADFVGNADDVSRLRESRSRDVLVARLNALLASTA